MLTDKIKKDRAFYKSLLTIVLPIIGQNAITNLVNLLDNIMVGTLGTEEMSGVSIVNQYYFIYTLLIFGAVSAAGIFTAQYKGLGDREGIKATIRAKFYMCLAAWIIGGCVIWFLQDPLIGFFLKEGSAEGDLELTRQFGKEYLLIIMFGLLPFALSSVYSSTMRENGETFFPMIASFVAVGTNFVLNGLLIFGLFGLPALGVRGAAIATVVSRFAELGCLAVYAHTKGKEKCCFDGVFRTFRVPMSVMKKIIVSGFPLIANELLWAIAMIIRNQCYATRGLDAVAAQNIASTVINLFSIVFYSMGTAIAIMIGNLLGAGKYEEAVISSRKLRLVSVFASAVTGALLFGVAFVFPLIYNTSADAKSIATFMIAVYAVCSPLNAYINSCYFTIRSGGQVFLTMLSDSIFMWAVVVPSGLVGAYLTGISIYWLYILCSAAECLKGLLGYFLVKSGVWIRRIVPENAEKS